MNQEQYKQFQAAPHQTNLLGIDDLANRAPRTLIFGYTFDRDSFHVYIGADGLIHVLRYSTLASSDESDNGQPRFLILSHSAGETGGVKDNAHFVPSKRVYPESCDYEFCQVLSRYSVNIPFTTFTEDADSHRLAKFDGYAGYTFAHSGGCATVSLREQLVADRFFPESARAEPRASQLSARLAAQAARELGIPYASSDDGRCVNVATSGSNEVLALARSYLRDLNQDCMPEDLGKRLAEAVFGAYHQFWMGSESVMAGTINATVNHEHLDFVVDPTRTQYMGKPGAFYEKAVLGTYDGRPFLACRTSGGETHIAYSQFGDTERFLKEQLRQFSLTPVAVTA